MSVVLLLLALIGPADAGVFESGSLSATWPARQVDQEYVLPRGWLELGIRAEVKTASGWRDGAGRQRAWAEGTRLALRRLVLGAEQGFSDHIALYLRVPVLWTGLVNARGADVDTVGLGDAHAGVRVQPWLGRSWAVGFRLDLKTPTGVEWPASLTGGPDDHQGFLTGTGTTSLGGFAYAHLRLGGWGKLALEAGWAHEFAAIVGYVVQDDGFGQGWLAPGEELLATPALTVQVLPWLAATVDATARWVGPYRMGTSGPGPTLRDLERVQGAAAWGDAGARVDVDPDPHWGLSLSASTQLLGGSTVLFGPLGLEEFAPHPGWSAGVQGRARW